ncbi:hypothetical protein R6Q59_026596 [Mikania micrantha]
MAQVSMVNKFGVVYEKITFVVQKKEHPSLHVGHADREEITKNHSARSELPDRSAQLGKPLKPDHSKQHSQRDRPSALSITRDELTTVFGIPSPGPNPDTGR